MPEEINNKKVFTLLEVCSSIQKTIAERYTSSYWVKAEMNKLNFYAGSGHCYPELVEKQEGRVVAQLKANIWKDNYSRINAAFLKVLKEPLRDGIKILMQVKINYMPEHGLSLNILDIDPAYTLGDLEQEKQDTIRKMKEEGIYNKNKLLKLPMLPKRIAIISVATSKGYLDFLGKIDTNSWGYKIFHMLFPALLQGENVSPSMIKQLRKIKKVQRHFDAVVIIRGGGGDVGLSAYNDYTLAKEVAMFPLPVLTGIGHITNETVVEMISHRNLITPTDLADYLLQQFHNFSVPVQQAEEKITSYSRRLLSEVKARFQSELKLFKSSARNIFSKHHSEIRESAGKLFSQSQFLFTQEQDAVETLREELDEGARLYMAQAKQDLMLAGRSMEKDFNAHFRSFKLLLDQNLQKARQASMVLIQIRRERIQQYTAKLSDRTLSLVENQKMRLANNETNVKNMDPRVVMQRGYSITRLNGRVIKNIEEIKAGDRLETLLVEGKITSIVESTKKSEENE